MSLPLHLADSAGWFSYNWVFVLQGWRNDSRGGGGGGLGLGGPEEKGP